VGIAHGSYPQQEKNHGVPELCGMPNRGHLLTIDHWRREVAETSLTFISRHISYTSAEFLIHSE
jgi:hypothetical protein